MEKSSFDFSKDEQLIINCLITHHNYDSISAEKIMFDYEGIVKGFSFSAFEISNILNEAHQENVNAMEWRNHKENFKKIFSDNELLKEGLDNETKLNINNNGDKLKFQDLGFFEKKIIKALVVVFRYSFEEAMSLLNEYFCIIHLLNDSHTGPDEWAQHLIGAKKEKITKQQWLIHIEEIEKIFNDF